MTQEEYIKQTSRAVNLLCQIFSEDMITVAKIRTSQAEGKTEALIDTLYVVKLYIGELIKDLEEI